MYPPAAKGRLSVVVKESLRCFRSANLLFEALVIRVPIPRSAYQRLMLISSASISSAVVMIFDEAE